MGSTWPSTFSCLAINFGGHGEMHLVQKSAASLSTRLAALMTLAWAFSVRVHAAGAGTLPWERPMQTIATSLTGPVAYAIGLIGIAIAEIGRASCRERV